ncbi:MAG TPA: type IV pilus twitching motility protein PilT [Planctomycetota bacterium]|nr:type IV pilus twitching motility protein PilT [Planctomycetota bacterium]HRR82347.1 type IV pilus twitching motility protein PilT [Planctomycetota bacterium]
MDILPLLTFMHKQGASDLHLATGAPPIVRIHGEMKKINAPPLAADALLAMLRQIMSDSQRQTYERDLELDFSFPTDFARFRVNAFVQRHGPSAVLRKIPNSVLPLEKLGLPPVVAELAMKDRGLILVTGPTGSGKSTTLASIIDYINERCPDHIITIEDPIEFVHESKQALISQREVGAHTHSFANALRSALREDPDVILVGEMRDLETTQLAITAAETGHLVLGTMHTSSAAKTCDRIVDIFPSERQEQIRTMFSESLLGIIAQTLIPTADGKGRAAAFEVLVGIPAARNLIREKKTAQLSSVIQTGSAHGMIALDQSLKDLVMRGRITREEALQRASNPNLFPDET